MPLLAGILNGMKKAIIVEGPKMARHIRVVDVKPEGIENLDPIKHKNILKAIASKPVDYSEIAEEMNRYIRAASDEFYATSDPEDENRHEAALAVTEAAEYEFMRDNNVDEAEFDAWSRDEYEQRTGTKPYW